MSICAVRRSKRRRVFQNIAIAGAGVKQVDAKSGVKLRLRILTGFVTGRYELAKLTQNAYLACKYPSPLTWLEYLARI